MKIFTVQEPFRTGRQSEAFHGVTITGLTHVGDFRLLAASDKPQVSEALKIEMLHDLRGHFVIIRHDMPRHFAEQFYINPDTRNVALIKLLNGGLDFLAGYNDTAIHLIMTASAEVVGVIPLEFLIRKTADRNRAPPFAS